MTFIACRMISRYGDSRNSFLPNSRTRSSTLKTKCGTRRSQSARRQAFGRRVRRPCRAYEFIRSRTIAARRHRKTSAADRLCHVVRSWPWRFSACRLRHGGGHGAKLDPHADFRRHAHRYPLRGYGHGVSAARSHSHRSMSIIFLSMPTNKCGDPAAAVICSP